MEKTGKQEAQSVTGISVIYSAPENALRALENLLFEMRSGARDPEEVKKEVEAAGEAYGRAVDYCMDTDNVDAARRICRVMGITGETQAGSRVVEFLQEKARVLSTAERTCNPRPCRFGDCYGGIIKVCGRLYSWLYDLHPEVLTGEAGQQKRLELAPELQEPGAKQTLYAAVREGLLNEDYSPSGKLNTKTLRAYFVMKFGEAMKWKDAFGKPQPKYALFERLWNEKGYGNLMRVKGYNGKGVHGSDIVDIFFTT